MRGQLTIEQRQQQIITRLKNENLRLREKAVSQESTIKKQALQIETLTLRVEELIQIIFGRKKKKDQNDNDDNNQSPIFKQPIKRSPQSYQRVVPTDNEVTQKEFHPLNTCPNCQTKLTRKKVVFFYEEDIPLPNQDRPSIKIVTKHQAEKGYCPKCKKWQTTTPLPFAKVILGKNVKLYICYLSILIRLSFAQIINLFQDTYNLCLSDGEINRVLQQEAIRLNPEFERLKQAIRQQSAAHYDETSWPVQQEEQGNFVWTMVGTQTNDAVFAFGKSRGKANASELKGKNNDQIGITDDYGAYRNLFAKHALCWSHPYRKLRDLANSDLLNIFKQKLCQTTSKKFQKLYAKIRLLLTKDFNLKERQQRKQEYMKAFDKLAAFNPGDPIKLKTIKKSLRKNKEKYFTCLTHDQIPADNNKAERTLRHLVLKRKVSYGSKTQAGADRLSILVSVLLSLWKERKTNFFQKYSVLGKS